MLRRIVKGFLLLLCLLIVMIGVALTGYYLHYTAGLDKAELKKPSDIPYAQLPAAAIAAYQEKERNRPYYWASQANLVARQISLERKLPHERSLAWQARGLFTTIWVKLHFSESEQLEYLLNRTYFGKDCYGIDCASKIYFNKPMNHLTPEDCAMLLKIMNAPSRYKDWKHV